MMRMMQTLLRIGGAMMPPAAKSLVKRLYVPGFTGAYGRSIIPQERVDLMLSLLDDVLDKQLDGDVIECGVLRGGSAIQIGSRIKERGVSKIVHGLDFFEDFTVDSVLSDADRQDKWTPKRVEKKFSASLIDEVRTTIAAEGLSDTVVLYKGAFADTFPTLEDARYCFAHVDCDYYSSVKEAIGFLESRLVPGGVMYFDDYNNPNWPGATQAAAELLGESNIVAFDHFQGLLGQARLALGRPSLAPPGKNATAPRRPATARLQGFAPRQPQVNSVDRVSVHVAPPMTASGLAGLGAVFSKPVSSRGSDMVRRLPGPTSKTADSSVGLHRGRCVAGTLRFSSPILHAASRSRLQESHHCPYHGHIA